MNVNGSSAPTPGAAQRVLVLSRPARETDSLSCWLALPRDISPDLPPLVAVHGIRRDARAQAMLLRSIAAEQGRPVIAPLFDEEHWRKYQLVVRNRRADLALLALMEELREAGIWRTDSFHLSGFSGGAQFAHRFAMLHPHLLSQLSVASAGWYTFPDQEPFPYGFAPRPKRKNDWGPRFEAGLQALLRIPIRVFVGSRDHLQDANLRIGPEINRQQGENRIERARRWTDALQRCARSRDLIPDITFTQLDDCPHDFRKCVEIGGLDRLIGRLSPGIGPTALPIRQATNSSVGPMLPEPQYRTFQSQKDPAS